MSVPALQNWHEGLTPLADRLGLQPLYGDIHNHCDLSYGHGTLPDALARAKLQLDFVSITGHAAWPDMPVDEASIQHIIDFHVKGFAKLRAEWMDHFTTLQAANNDGFTVFPGYEIHSCADGDYTIVYRDLTPAPLVLEDTPSALKTALSDTKGDGALAFPHHIGYRRGARGINWESFDADLSPFVEMNSMHGCAETSENPLPYLHSMGPVDGGSTMHTGLAMGKIFGVVGNTDHHSGYPGSHGHGRMAVYAPDNDRNAIWSALRARHTNALTGDRMHVLASLDGKPQGCLLPPHHDALLDIEVVAGGPIDSIDVIRDGVLARRITPALQPAPIGPPDETLLRLELGWGERGTFHHWQGTLALHGGEIMAAEPRFRGFEVVSPLEGTADTAPLPTLSLENNRVDFSVTAEANPNNRTPAMQALTLRVRAEDDATLEVNLSGAELSIQLSQLYQGSLSGNLGIIDTPAFRFVQLPRPDQWQWAGRVSLGDLKPGQTVYLRVRQVDGQMAWTSPFFIQGDPA